jgi:hypothetical protein
MRRGLRYRIRLFGWLLPAACFLIFGGSSCGGGGEADYQQGARILYYPRSNAYLDLDNHLYLVFDTVEQQWGRKGQLTEAEQQDLGPSVPIENAPVPVYRDNGQHKLVYGTSIFTDDAVLARKRREDSLATAAPPPPEFEKEPEPAPEPKRKTRVGRWLQKIFGKKDRS